MTIYDFTNKISPSSFSPMHRLAHRLFAFSDARRADSILTISQGTRQQIYRRFGRDALVVTPAVDNIFTVQAATRVNQVLSEYGVQAPYLLNVATWEPRKNVAALVKAFLSLKQCGKLPQHSLVLAGHPGRASTEVMGLVQSAGNHVKVLGYVPREDLPCLFSGADAFVFPSLYEGFGMPVAEALACGTRVVTTDSMELREAGGDRCIYIEPSEAGIKLGIELACCQPFEQSRPNPQYTWSDGAAVLAMEINRLLK
ncbi:MAG: glycosyltransferase family 4 protein [Nodosilinea sp. LVE1205-7]